MRILLVSHSFPPVSYAGTEIYTYNLARSLMTLGHEVLVVYRTSLDKYGNYSIQINSFDNIPILTINKLFYKENFKKTYFDEKIDELFASIIDTIKPDLVHINHVMNLSMGIVNVIKKRKIPVVMTLHDYWLICPQIHIHKNFDLCYSKNEADCSLCIEKQGFTKDIRHIKERDMIAADILNKIDTLISPSIFLKNKFTEFFNLDKRKILHIQNGIAVENADHNIIAYSRDKIVLGYFGFVAKYKGLHILLEAFEKIDKTKYDLCIYGLLDPTYAEFLDNTYKWWRNKYYGPYKNYGVINLMRNNIDVLVFPIIIYENCPTVINEALYAGVPVICVNIGGASELIRENANGLLFNNLEPDDLKEKIESLTDETLDRLKSNLKKHQPYSFKEHAMDIVNLYKKHIFSKIKVFGSESNIIDKFFNLLNYKEGCHFISTLFIDTDNGFNGKEYVQQVASLLENNNFSVTFDLKGFTNIKQLRFDPLENKFCRLKIIKIISETSTGTKEYLFSEISSNIITNGKILSDGYIDFETLDPQVVLPILGEVKQITIEGEIQVHNTAVRLNDILNQKSDELTDLRNQLNERTTMLNERTTLLNVRTGLLDVCNQNVVKCDAQIASLNQTLNFIMASKSWRLTAPLRRLSEIVHSIANRQKLKNLIFQMFGFAFARTESYKHWKASQQSQTNIAEKSIVRNQKSDPIATQHEDCFKDCELIITRTQQPYIAEVGSDITNVRFATIDPKKVKNILVIKLDYIGDIILSLPAIKMLRDKYPQARITMLAGKWAKPLVEAVSDIDELIEFDYYNERSEEWKARLIQEKIEKIKAELCSGAFDMAIDLRREIGNGEVFGWFDAKYKVAYYTSENKDLITHGLHFSKNISNVPGVVFKPHITSQLCALIEAIPDENGGYKKNMPIPVPSIKLENNKELLQNYAKLLSADFLVGLNPGTGSTIRQWPENYFTALADLLIEHLDSTIVFFGSHAEKSLIARIASQVKSQNKVFTLAGKLSLKEFMLMAKQMRLFVGNVSGSNHIASMLGVPTLAIFAGQVTPYEWHPLGYKYMCTRVSVPCAPCYLAIPEQCPYNLKCLKLLYPEKIYEAVKKLLEESGLGVVRKGAT